jgi:3-methyladenine DNA glycosylase AlkD
MKIFNKIKRDLKAEIDSDFRDNFRNFFKEDVTFYGVRTPIGRNIAKKYFKEEVSFLSKKELFDLCEELLKSNYQEEAIIAIQFLRFKIDEIKKSDFKILEKYLDKYINNWSKDDNYCLYVLGPIVERYPELKKDLFSWTKSKNMWVRRAAAVSLIPDISNNLKESFEMAKILMSDKEDLVQKAYGWMLKVASNYYQKEVFNFVIENKKEMTRTALRYAIEKMPKDLKIKAMKI